MSATKTAAPSVTATYVYDPLGRRRAKTVNGVRTVYLSAGDQEIAEYAGSPLAVQRRYVYGAGLDEPVATVTAAGAVSYHLADGLGSVIALVTSAGVLSEKHGYTAYGVSTVSTGTAFQFAGRRFDPETGLYHNRARAYSPALGRFLQADPIGIQGGLNLYAYVGNDPANLTDPMGTTASSRIAGGLGGSLTGNPMVDTDIMGNPLYWSQEAQIAAGGSVAAVLAATGAGVILEGAAVTAATPALPAFVKGGKTFGVLRTSAGDFPLQSGWQGPASSIPRGSAGFDIVTRTHVEGHAAALMRQQGATESKLFINNPEVCSSCSRLLQKMLPNGSSMDVVLPDGTVFPFSGR